MTDVGDLREQKRQELLQRLEQQKLAEQQQAEAERQIDGLLSTVLEPEAKTRLSNVRLVNPELHIKVSQMLLTLKQNGRLPGKVTEAQLKELLEKLSVKKEISITRK